MNSSNVLQRVPDPVVAGSVACFNLLVVDRRNSERVSHLLLRHSLGLARGFQLFPQSNHPFRR